MADNTSGPVAGEEHETYFHIILNRPPANALGLPIVEGLEAALNRATAAHARTLVLSSAIEGFFAAGADIKLMSQTDRAGFEAYGDALRDVLNRLESYPGVSIACIDGLALGGGLELALASTLRVASSHAQLGLPEVKIGLIPGAGGTQRLPRLIGAGRATEIIVTGRQVGAEEALAIGLVTQVTDDSTTALAAGIALAESFRSTSALARAAASRSVRASFSALDGFACERDEVGTLFESDGSEGLRAFIEKRKPSFAP